MTESELRDFVLQAEQIGDFEAAEAALRKLEAFKAGQTTDVKPDYIPTQGESLGKIFSQTADSLNPFSEEAKSVVFASQEEEVTAKLGNVDFESYPAWTERFEYGIQDNPQEIANAFMKDYPNGEVHAIRTDYGPRLMYREQANNIDEPWKPINPTGISIGDISGAIPAIAAGVPTAIATGGASVPVQLGSTFAATFIAELAKQGYQTISETQEQDFQDQFLQSGTMASLDTTMGGIFHLGSRFLPFPRADVSDEQRAMIDKIQEAFTDINEENAALMAHQIAHDAPQLVTQAKQAAALHRAIPERQKAQATYAVKKADELGTLDASMADINDLLRRSANRWSIEETKHIVGGMPNVRSMSIMFKNAIGDDFLSKSRRDVTNAYLKADEIAAKEQPRFSLVNAKGAADNVIAGTEGEFVQQIGPQTLEVTQQNISTDPTSKLRSIAQRVNELYDIQPDYNTLKSLRTDLYNIRSTHRFTNDNNKRLANKLYDALTESLNNPVTKAPKFVEAHKKAADLASKRFGVIENEQISKMLATDTPAEIVNWLSKPGNLHQDVISVLHKYSPEKVDAIRNGIVRNILTDKSKSPVSIIADYDLNDPKMLHWLAGGKNNLNDMYEMAYDIERIYSSPLEPIAIAQTDAIKAFDLIDTPQQAREFISRIGPEQSQVFYREVMLKDIIERSIIKKPRTGGFAVNEKIMSEAMRKYEKNGMLDLLLTPHDKQRLSALTDYVQLTGSESSDLGVALVTNQLTGKYRSSVAKANIKGVMDARLQGLYATMLSKLITSPKGNLTLLRGLEGPITSKTARSIGIAAGALSGESLQERSAELSTPDVHEVGTQPVSKPPIHMPKIERPEFEIPAQPQQGASILPPSMRQEGSLLGEMAERQGFFKGGIALLNPSIEDRGEGIADIRETLIAVNRKAGVPIDIENTTYL